VSLPEVSLPEVSLPDWALSDLSLQRSGAFVKEATHLVVYLNLKTFVGVRGHNFAAEVRVALSKGLPILLVHECDVKRGGCEFDRFFQTTPHDLIKKGLYSAVAVPLHSGIHRRVSYEVAARALGAGGASLRERATHVATSISRATQSFSWKHASTMIHKLPSAHASGRGSARAPGHNEHQAPAEGHTTSSVHTEHPAPGRDQAPPRKSSSQTPLISSSHGASMSSSLSDVHLHSVAIDAPSHDDASHVASSGASANYSPAYVPNVPPNLVVAPHVDAAPAEPCSAEDDSDARAEMQLQNALASGRVVALSAQASTSSEVLEVDWI